ncbi:hypothetical protein M9Y10_036528 [Tritrichomonas musculus]|uniref:Uracil permease n=1 Tax=Tritrichomonas musculus TaxID=1915356 RepID=A0ABR2GWA4_9EUKA
MHPKAKLYLLNCALAFQHLFAVLGGIVVVPNILGMNTSMGIFASGFGTLLFYLVTKRQVPVFHGSSFTYMAGLQIFKDKCYEKGYIHKGNLNVDPYIGRQATGIIFAGLLYWVISVIVYYVGPQRISKLFPPVVVGPIVITIGLSLCPSIISSNIVAEYSGERAKFHGYQVWVVVVLTDLVIICMTCFAPGIWNALGIIFGIVVGYIASACFQVIDYSGIKSSNWILFQPEEFKSTFWFWGKAKWDWSAVGMIAPLAVVGLMEHLGDISTNSAVCGKEFFVEPGLHRTIFGDGCALVGAGILGAPPMATYSQNTGVLVITKNFNPDVLAICAGYAMFLGIITKVGAIFKSIPAFVIGAASMMMFGIISCMGIKVLIMNDIDITKSRNLIIVAVILIIGVGFDTGGVEMIAGDVTITSLAVATLFGVVLNLILPHKLPGDNSPGDGGNEGSENLKDVSESFEQYSSTERGKQASEDEDDEYSDERDTVQEV